MTNVLALVPVLVAAILMPVLLKSERDLDRRILVPTKTAMSVMFVVTGAMQQPSLADYKPWILTGLIFCLAGDIFLALPHPRAFLLGLGAFLIGHVWYVMAFAHHVGFAAWVALAWLALLVFASYVFRWLRPHVGSMLGPVVAYIVVISIMVAAAFAMSSNADLELAGRLLALSGALAFFASDLFVAKDRFLGREARNRYIGLPLYYGAQFLIAVSIGAF